MDGSAGEPLNARLEKLINKEVRVHIYVLYMEHNMYVDVCIYYNIYTYMHCVLCVCTHAALY
jgi:hypothetical protein